MANNNKRKPFRNKGAATPKKKVNQARTVSGRVPQGRTLSTYDNYLGDGYKTGSRKERPVVVIEANKQNDLAVVPLTTQDGNNRTQLKNYQQGQSRFKHHIEIEDNEGNPIRVNKKFRENSPKLDVSKDDVKYIRSTVFNHSKPMKKNKEKINKFRGK